MDRPGRERQGGEGDGGGPALQQLLPASDSPVSAMPLEQSHTALWGGRGHRVPVLGPWGPNWEIPGSALPSPRLPHARPAGEEETRAARRHLLLLRRRCRRRRSCASVPVAAAAAAGPAASSADWRRGGSPASPRGWKRAACQPRCAPRPPRPSPGYPRTPARPGRAPGSERAAAQVGASWSLAHATLPPPPGASRPSPTPGRPLHSRAGGKAGLGHPRGRSCCPCRAGGVSGEEVYCHLVVP